MSKCICPACNGTGKVIRKKDKHFIKRDAIKKLQDDGYSIREIMKQMGYKSPSTITHYLKKNKLWKIN